MSDFCHDIHLDPDGNFIINRSFSCSHPGRDIIAEYGRQLANEREDLIAAGENPAEIAIPRHPDDIQEQA